jgi:hypothetical protein
MNLEIPFALNFTGAIVSNRKYPRSKHNITSYVWLESDALEITLLPDDYAVCIFLQPRAIISGGWTLDARWLVVGWLSRFLGVTTAA